MAEVLYDNSAQTFMPAIVSQPNLERPTAVCGASRWWPTSSSADLWPACFCDSRSSWPFYVDVATFAVSAALIVVIAATPRVRTKPAAAADADADAGSGTVISGWVGEAKQGFVWLGGTRCFGRSPSRLACSTC